MRVIKETNSADFPLLGRGKVRDIYDLGDKLLIAVSDRVSAFDVVLNEGIPFKGHVLNLLSEFWFKKTAHIIDNHLITCEVSSYGEEFAGRSMVVKKARPILCECVVRGYLTGSGLKEYRKTGAVCGVKLPRGLKEAEKLPEPIFTPSTKAELGAHDENITFDKLKSVIGAETAETARGISLKLYSFAAEYALSKGIIIADTKFEFGEYDGKIILIDEALTPDSSRFWRKDVYAVGKAQDSMDKQVIRDYLETSGWSKTPPPPPLPLEITRKTTERYLEIKNILLG